MLYNFAFSIDCLKKEQFLRFWPLSISSLKLGHNSILTQSRPHLYRYLIHRQTESIDRIGAILVTIEQSKWF